MSNKGGSKTSAMDLSIKHYHGSRYCPRYEAVNV
jgi:hypothetical protein